MLTILQARDYSPYKQIINNLFNDVTFMPCVGEATDNNDVIGFVVYHFDEEKVVIDYVESYGDLYLYDGLVRSALFLAMNKNVDVAEFQISNKINIIKLGFVNNNNNFIDSISLFMSNCKNCKN